ncbi:MAG: family 10 glycosylhydrolase [Richelia sp. RM2_1_2]|nr:family 10 glycosylhydrolase [Richelia sp. SM2_1_7]NJM20055.1 family 10 glycosylhydrolase [Richelia sp. SM1_7_0]NJN09300.1 family 10 glycosylhydrolase [Richelia sp. RM1_1_1]NJO26966.1 family 10 glycosylhydrolase [Richelia sp. SL_2_1]NJO59439.1 family 10 glycosylhydrolase [Richelia sp. RM2_1_2]
MINQFKAQGLQVHARLVNLFRKLNLPKFATYQLLKRCFPLVFIISFSTVLLLDNLNNLESAIAQFPPAATIIQPEIIQPEIIQPQILQPRQLPRQQIRGVWMSTNDFNVLRNQSAVKDAVTQLRRLNFNTIYPVVWNSGYTKFPSATARGAGIPFFFKGSNGQDMLADLISQAHRQGLLAIPWFEFGFMVPESSELALNHPEWLTQKRDGSLTSNSAAGEVAWLNPFHPQVQQFIQNLVLEVVSQYDVDGIQFDDHMSLPREFGYDSYTVALYTQETQNPPPSNVADEAWVKWRADKITAFMLQLNQAVKARKPDVIFSVSPNYYNHAYKLQLQDWLNWVRLSIVDELIMQVYRNDLASFVDKINLPEMLETKQYIPTGVGIMAGLRNRPVSMQQIKSQVRAAQQNNLGVTFFYYETLWNHAQENAELRQAGFQSLFPRFTHRSRI